MRGFYWSANSPYIRGHWLRVRRAPRAPGISTTVTDGFIDITVGGRTHRNANPAYMIYECLTNTTWGMGGAEAMMGASFAAAAPVLKNEGFGLFMKWVQSDTIENFLSEILDHIQAFLFLSPLTGKWELKLLRADYNVADLPAYDEDNASFEGFDRKLPGETINEIVVTWTNPVTEKPETVTMQDLANIVQQGGQVVSQSRNYYGIRTSALALAVAARDLRTACSPLASVTMHAFRSAWATVPGDCVRVSLASENADNLVMRVQAVDYGDGSSKYVTVTLLEDIFAADAPVYTGASDSQWGGTAAQPSPPNHVKLFTVPAFIVANSADEYVVQPVEPEVNAALLVASDNTDFLNYEPYTAFTLPTGDIVQDSLGTRQPVGWWSTTDALLAEATSTFAGFPARVGPAPQLADLVFIGGGGDNATEIALIQAVDTDGVYTFARGVLDTVPRAWPAGTPMWFLGSQAVLDAAARAPGETVSYRPLMRTSLGLLAYDSGEMSTITLSERPYLPLRPANVQVNGQGFGTVALAGGAANVTWSNRNRLLETSQILGWQAPTVAVEAGQTTTVRTLDNVGSPTHTYAGLTSTATTIVAADLVGAVAIEVYSVGTEGNSLQSYILPITP